MLLLLSEGYVLSYIYYSLAKKRNPIKEEKHHIHQTLHQRGIVPPVQLIIGTNATFPATGQKLGPALMETMMVRPSAEAMPLIATNVESVLMGYGVTEVFLMDISVKFIKSGFLEAITALYVRMRD